MGITAISGPAVSYGITITSSGGVTEYNEERGPSLSDLGHALMDPRPAYNYDPGNPVGTPVGGFLYGEALVDAVPFYSGSSVIYRPGTIVSCLAISTGSSALGAATLNTTVSSAVGVWLNQTLFDPETGGTFTANMVCDLATSGTTPAPTLTFGTAGTVAIWNPANAIARAIAITGSSSGLDDSGTTVSVAGRDLYGYKMSETITLGSNSANGVLGAKAFKTVTSVTFANSSLIASTHINIGFGDKFGFPSFAQSPAFVSINSVSSDGLVVNFVAGSSIGVSYASTAAATATTSDVRGTWSSTAAAVVWTGSNRLQIRVRQNPVNLNAISGSNTAGLFGQTQYST